MLYKPCDTYQWFWNQAANRSWKGLKETVSGKKDFKEIVSKSCKGLEKTVGDALRVSENMSLEAGECGILPLYWLKIWHECCM